MGTVKRGKVSRHGADGQSLIRRGATYRGETRSVGEGYAGEEQPRVGGSISVGETSDSWGAGCRSGLAWSDLTRGEMASQRRRRGPRAQGVAATLPLPQVHQAARTLAPFTSSHASISKQPYPWLRSEPSPFFSASVHNSTH